MQQCVHLFTVRKYSFKKNHEKHVANTKKRLTSRLITLLLSPSPATGLPGCNVCIIHFISVISLGLRAELIPKVGSALFMLVNIEAV